MNSKVWLTTFGVISLVSLLGGGFYAYSSYASYKEAVDGWDAKVSTIETLERRNPYPNKENSEELEKRASTYEAEVEKLVETLKGFQPELNTELRNTDFQQLVKTKVEDFRKFAQAGKLAIDPNMNFQLGFDAYANSVPAPDLVPILDYELKAIEYLLQRLVKCGVAELVEFGRDPIPGETGASASQESGVVHKYPVRLRFRSSHDAFQRFVNEVANEKQFFYIVRVLKVENASLEGPHKLTADDGRSFQRFQNPQTLETASPQMVQEWSADGATAEDVENRAKAAGFIKADVDARILMGQEELRTFMVVDIARFLSAKEVQTQNPEPEVKKGKK
ncbi:MAG TPA: Amuc_1100 family pilus-like protein [Bacteroidia bacterium]|nr:Amuc_1100 family pilus-like protein [Bacteroidia bacterium]